MAQVCYQIFYPYEYRMSQGASKPQVMGTVVIRKSLDLSQSWKNTELKIHFRNHRIKPICYFKLVRSCSCLFDYPSNYYTCAKKEHNLPCKTRHAQSLIVQNSKGEMRKMFVKMVGPKRNQSIEKRKKNRHTFYNIIQISTVFYSTFPQLQTLQGFQSYFSRVSFNDSFPPNSGHSVLDLNDMI